MRNVINQLTVSLVRTVDIKLLTLEFTDTIMEVEVSYLVIMTVKHWWNHIRQYRTLTVGKLHAIVKHDLQTHQVMNLPNLSRTLYNIIVN